MHICGKSRKFWIGKSQIISSNLRTMSFLGPNWHHVGPADDIEEEDVMRFDLGDQTFTIYNTQDNFYATDGLCTHEDQNLADGLVFDDIIECPLHQGRFHIPSGKAKSAPVCVDLKTYEMKVLDGTLYIQVLS